MTTQARTLADAISRHSAMLLDELNGQPLALSLDDLEYLRETIAQRYVTQQYNVTLGILIAAYEDA